MRGTGPLEQVAALALAFGHLQPSLGPVIRPMLPHGKNLGEMAISAMVYGFKKARYSPPFARSNIFNDLPWRTKISFSTGK